MALSQLANLDKSKWKKFPFGKIARSIGERVDPTTTNLETYVGLEHIDAESIHIKRFGTKADVSGTKLRCYPGDVIFGRRRAYQRKAAICEFDGFCSAHSLVLRANPEVIDPKLFPFFLHSDRFMHRAVDISVGSLSPTINWTTLKTQEFLLPPKDQQAKLAELLWAADAQWQLHERVKDSAYCALTSFVDERILNNPRASGMRLEEVTQSMDGGKSPVCENEDYVPGTPGILKTSAVTSGKFIHSEAKTVKKKDLESLAVSVQADSILINRKNTRELVGISCYVTEDYPNLYLSDLIWQIRTNEKAQAKYLFYILSSARLRNRLSSLSNGTSTSMVNIAKGNVSKIRISLPPPEVQRSILNEIKRFEQSADLLETAADTSRDLLKSLINQIF